MSIEMSGLQVSVSAVVPAAGFGRRMGGGAAKQFLSLRGEPVLVHTIRLLSACPLVDEIIVAAHDLETTAELVAHYPKVASIVRGGYQRQDSVWAGIQAVHSRPRVICVHDAVRPLLAPTVLEEILRAAAHHSAQVVATPVKDTIKAADDRGTVIHTLDRGSLWAVQTPQVFWAEVLVKAFRQAMTDGFVGTDCASLVERTGTPVRVYPGSPENLKLTTPEDFVIAEAIMERRRQQ